MLGFYVDSDVCTGCRTCVVACRDKNDLPIDVSFRHVTTFETGTFPNVKMYHLSLSCNNCGSPACLRACSCGAIFVADDGTVQFDDGLCIGCGNCVEACPYGEPQIIPDLNVMHKCNSCKPLRDAGMNPVCVDACLMRALEFGDLDEIRARHEGEMLVSELPCLPEASVTSPSTIVHPKEAAFEESYKETIL